MAKNKYYPYEQTGLVKEFIQEIEYKKYLLHRKDLSDSLVLEAASMLQTVVSAAKKLAEIYRKQRYVLNEQRSADERSYMELRVLTLKKGNKEYYYIKWVKWLPRKGAAKSRSEYLNNRKNEHGIHFYDLKCVQEQVSGKRMWVRPYFIEAEACARVLRESMQRIQILKELVHDETLNAFQECIRQRHIKELAGDLSYDENQACIDTYIRGDILLDPLRMNRNNLLRGQSIISERRQLIALDRVRDCFDPVIDKTAVIGNIQMQSTKSNGPPNLDGFSDDEFNPFR